MIKELFEEKFGFTLGERVGTKSSYGEAYVMPTKSKIVKIFYAKSDDLANREIAITTIMGLEGVGPKLFNAGKLDDKYYYMVMERISGDLLTMPRWLRKKYEPEINAQILKLMDKMHSLGFIHGDLKWDNIGYKNVKQSAPKIYILDFGLSIKFPRNIRTNLNVVEGIARAYRAIGIRPRNFVTSPQNLRGALKRAVTETNRSSVSRTRTLGADNLMGAALSIVNNKPLKVSIPKGMRVPSLKSRKYVDNYQYNEFFNEIPQRPTRPRSITPPVIFEQLTPEFVPNPNYKRTPPVIRYPKLFDPMSPPYSYHNIPANDPKKIKKTTPNLEAKKRNMMLLSPIIENILAEIPDDTVSAKSPEVRKAAKKLNLFKKTPEIRGNTELMGLLDELALSYVALLKLSYIKTRSGKLTKKQMAIRDELRRERDNLRKIIKRRFNRYNIKNVELL
jgi:serine/threonine protein kinase